MALATVTDVEVALGLAPNTLTATQAARVQQYLDTLSAMVNEATGRDFGSATETVRMQADGNGDILMARYEPVTSVTAVVDYNSGEALSASPGTGPQIYHWDGLMTIYGLYPRQVVDVTLTHGETSVPASLKGIVVEATKRAYESTKSNLRARQVADVSEEYNPTFEGSLYFTAQERETIAGWEETETSWHLAVRPDQLDPREYYLDSYWPNGPYL